MAEAALKNYGYYDDVAYEPEYEPRQRAHKDKRPAFRTVQGAKADAKPNALAAHLTRKVVVAASAILVFVVAVCVARVALTTATVQALSDSQQLTQDVSDARTAGYQLEVQHAVAASSTHIQDVAANSLGMSQDPSIETYPAQSTLTPDAKSAPAASSASASGDASSDTSSATTSGASSAAASGASDDSSSSASGDNSSGAQSSAAGSAGSAGATDSTTGDAAQQ
ncbi:MAG: hypothetical protein LBM21_01770 [Coriobacteriales bacterium]|jgi:cell division protein FtsL|nr:hypothetical protein [Coriobacteriales bacterium]